MTAWPSASSSAKWGALHQPHEIGDNYRANTRENVFTVLLGIYASRRNITLYPPPKNVYNYCHFQKLKASSSTRPLPFLSFKHDYSTKDKKEKASPSPPRDGSCLPLPLPLSPDLQEFGWRTLGWECSAAQSSNQGARVRHLSSWKITLKSTRQQGRYLCWCFQTPGMVLS